jgi:hypothetical protein
MGRTMLVVMVDSPFVGWLVWSASRVSACVDSVRISSSSLVRLEQFISVDVVRSVDASEAVPWLRFRVVLQVARFVPAVPALDALLDQPVWLDEEQRRVAVAFGACLVSNHAALTSSAQAPRASYPSSSEMFAFRRAAAV